MDNLLTPPSSVPWALRYPSRGRRPRAAYPKKGRSVSLPLHDRPKTRADCANVPRPCPYVGCRYHLYLDVNEDTGGLRIAMDGEPWEMAESCALDVVDRHPDGLRMGGIGTVMGVSRERVRQILKRPLLEELAPLLEARVYRRQRARAELFGAAVRLSEER